MPMMLIGAKSVPLLMSSSSTQISLATNLATTPQSPVKPGQMIQTFLDGLSGTQPTAQPQGTTDAKETDSGSKTQNTGSTINSDDSLLGFCTHHVHGQQRCLILTKQHRIPFRLTNDMGNNCPAHHFMDGSHQVINCSGNLCCFSKWDGKQQKAFIFGAPKPLTKTHTRANGKHFIGFQSGSKSVAVQHCCNSQMQFQTHLCRKFGEQKTHKSAR